MDYRKRIKESGLAFKIRNVSAEIFFKWAENAERIYNVSSELLRREPLDEIESVFIDHLIKSFESWLIKKETKEAKSLETQKGWDFGFICGHVTGSINVSWKNKYIVQACDGFEDVLIKKAVYAYLGFDHIIMNRISLLYEHLIENKEQLIDSVKPIPPNIISMFNSRSRRKAKLQRYNEKILKFLEDDFVESYVHLSDKFEEQCCPDINEYLTVEDIISIFGIEYVSV